MPNGNMNGERVRDLGNGVVAKLEKWIEIPVRVKRWNDVCRIKLANQAEDDERLLNICQGYANLLCRRRLRPGEEWVVVILAKPLMKIEGNSNGKTEDSIEGGSGYSGTRTDDKECGPSGTGG